MELVWRVLQIIGMVVTGLVVLSATVGTIWYFAVKKYRALKKAEKQDRVNDEQEHLRPYREAAEGYRLQVEQLERDISRLRAELADANSDRDTLRKRVKELEEIIVSMSRLNNVQQGDIDRLKRQVEDLGDLRTQLTAMLKEIKTP